MSRRPLGVRLYLMLTMMALAVATVAITGMLIERGVSRELAVAEPELGQKLTECVMRALAEAGTVSAGLAILLALPVGLGLARPLRQLSKLAAQLGKGGLPRPRGGVREIAELAGTMERLSASLRRQDELRRATAADVTHELRGNLGSVLGHVEAVLDGLIDRDAGLRQIAGDARRMERVLDDLPRLVEAQRPSLLMARQPVELDALVRGRASAHALRFRAAGVALALDVEPESVHGDPSRLEQVVDNLLSNALRYTDAGGAVTVALRHTQDEAVIEVSDSGIGISPEHTTRVFDRFWRGPAAVERASDGSGVGLALVRELVLAHHGRVHVQSEVGRGTRFSVHLPHVPRRAGEPPPRAIASRGAGAGADPAVVQLRGDVDMLNAAEVERALLRRIWSTTTDLRLDLSEVGIFGSSAISVLVCADAEIRARGGSLIIVGAPPVLELLLRDVGLLPSALEPAAPPVDPGERDDAVLSGAVTASV